ncbi:hypothetical protein LYZ86_00100 [Xanthomonas hortorum pv. cynarae]|uniref:hypothetical protein n=1 Tax=Xanthomonas hortorum TaxID=56454 RepID=UPI000CEDD782|nr:hypothetical protein [Xanthomonas hortorum]MCC4624385.1 hypothetical protein [Xanthomonas campestris pv. nigromaculans]MCE4347692.1 hypothetical protein [Xanthomonas hortorum pv. cynarae]PPU48870.1 hypothetical protein XcyCFBP4188_02735 [Xanthomonas hortorum pv. cynarae]CAH2708348.1 hypothetical protein NCPPB1935_11340 [Xanthomonas campestris pv. nigromaculans]
MPEEIYNIFLFFDPNGRCERVGYVAHSHDGEDEQGIELLRKKAKGDLQNATKVKLAKPFTLQEYNTRSRLGSVVALYAEALLNAGGLETSLTVVTPVEKGRVRFDYSAKHWEFDVDEAAEAAGEQGEMVDWLLKYSRKGGIQFSELIHDDYFHAIKITYNARLYVSSMKLMLSCIDSLAYIEYGDLRGLPIFVRWLNDFADLAPLGITAEELWELRNGLLHMSNINSSAVKQNKVRRISFHVGQAKAKLPDTGSVFFFEFRGLIDVFALAQARWFQSYADDTSKFEKFVERYDETVSDGRLAEAHIGSGP